MAHVGVAVIGLGLAAQYLLHDQRQQKFVVDLVDQVVEHRRLDDLAHGKAHVEAFEIVFQRDQLFARRRFVDAIDDRRLLRFQHLRRSDIGDDHIILDHAVRIEAFADRDLYNLALVVEHHALFGEIEIERLALVARPGEQLPAGP